MAASDLSLTPAEKKYLFRKKFHKEFEEKHFFSGAMLGALGFILVEWLNASEKVHVSLSPAFISLFAFCFALSCGAVWEIYEFSCDTLLGLNMQKYMTGAGEMLAGRLALRDTMKDIIVDAASAALMAVLGFARLKANREQAEVKA